MQIDNKKEKSKEKILWQVYTPLWIVNTILDQVWYNGKEILKKYIIEPSCWNWIFLWEIIKRYIKVGKENNLTEEEILNDIEEYIYWIEIEEKAYIECIKYINNIIKSKIGKNNLKINNRNIINWDTLIEYKKIKKEFDFVVWNPPYVRIHNLDVNTIDLIRNEFQFNTWIIDLYITFFEIWFKLLKKDTWKLGYITPNSFIKNTTYKKFRNYLSKNKNLVSLIDFQSNNIFKWFSTYTAISIFDNLKNENNTFDYYRFINNKIEFINKIKFPKENEKWNLISKEEENVLNNNLESKKNKVWDFYNVQYWFATLRDKVFYSKIVNKEEYNNPNNKEVLFNWEYIEKDLIKKVVKASKYNWQENIDEILEYVLFPYKLENNKYQSFKEEELKENFPKTYNYLLKNKNTLTERNLRWNTNWYEFWRSQGINTINNKKILISPLFKNKIFFIEVEEDIFIYSGLFAFWKNLDIIKNILWSEDFFKFAKLNWKNFSWWYFTLSSKTIKEYKY